MDHWHISRPRSRPASTRSDIPDRPAGVSSIVDRVTQKSSSQVAGLLADASGYRNVCCPALLLRRI
jgi:hypothetical protein